MTKKLTITKKKAISECKKLWAETEKSGLLKYPFLRSKEGAKWYTKNYRSSCPLCEYAYQVARNNKDYTTCRYCPLVTQYNKECHVLGFLDYGRIPVLPKWYEAIRGLK